MKNLDNESKKSLRSTSQYFLDMSRRLEKAFLKFLMFSEISAKRLILMSDQVQTVKGLKTGRLSGDRSSVDESIQYLIRLHPELESCKIAFSSCSDSSLQALFLIPNISIIKLKHCELITGEILVHDLDSEEKPKLKVLNLCGCCKLTDIGLVGLLNLTDGESLTKLNLALTKITLNNIGDLTNRFPNLKKLNLGGCDNITDAGIIMLLNRVGGDLEHLDLSDTNITLNNIRVLSTRFPKLVTLKLKACKKITDAGILSLLNLVGGDLEELNLSDTNVTLDNMADLTSSSPKLVYLYLDACYNITDAGTILLLNRVGGELKQLGLAGTNITLNSMGDLNSRFLKLELLSFYRCPNITDAGTILLLNRVGGELKQLDLSGTHITLNSMGDLNSRFLKLEKLSFYCCPNITDAGTILLLNRVGGELKRLDLSATNIALNNLGSLTSSFPQLEFVDLESSPNITEAGVISLLNKVGHGVRVRISYTPVSAANIRNQFPSLTVEDDESIHGESVESMVNLLLND